METGIWALAAIAAIYLAFKAVYYELPSRKIYVFKRRIYFGKKVDNRPAAASYYFFRWPWSSKPVAVFNCNKIKIAPKISVRIVDYGKAARFASSNEELKQILLKNEINTKTFERFGVELVQ